jgi:hypothetical protein
VRVSIFKAPSPSEAFSNIPSSFEEEMFPGAGRIAKLSFTKQDEEFIVHRQSITAFFEFWKIAYLRDGGYSINNTTVVEITAHPVREIYVQEEYQVVLVVSGGISRSIRCTIDLRTFKVREAGLGVGIKSLRYESQTNSPTSLVQVTLIAKAITVGRLYPTISISIVWPLFVTAMNVRLSTTTTTTELALFCGILKTSPFWKV